MAELSDLQALILLILMEVPEGGLDAEEIVREVERRARMMLSP